jgi:hypothetical protein
MVAQAVIPEVESLRKEDCQFEANTSYRVSSKASLRYTIGIYFRNEWREGRKEKRGEVGRGEMERR